MKKKKIFSIMLLCLLFNGCANQNKASSGAFLGALSGGVIGSMFGKGEGRLVGIGLGAAMGALFGSYIGTQLDERDKLLAGQKTQFALESNKNGVASEWNNPDSGHRGYIAPTKTYRENNLYCREFTHKVIIGGKQHTAYGNACRMPDGQWKIKN